MAYAEPEPMDQDDLDKAGKALVGKDPASRMEAAVAMRVHGANYSEIARVLGYSNVTSARLAVERGLSASATTEGKEYRRLLESRRIERLMRSVMRRATDETDSEHLGYVRTALALVDRHARLWGLDAPQEMIMYNPTATEMDQWIATHRKAIEQDYPEEADIIEGSVISSDIGDDE
jgi:hypothetical protein